MTILSDNDRRQVWAHMMRTQFVQTAATLGVNKPDLRAAVDAIDQWVEDNQSSFNQSIPLPARTALTSTQKALLFTYVVMRRQGILHVDGD